MNGDIMQLFFNNCVCLKCMNHTQISYGIQAAFLLEPSS